MADMVEGAAVKVVSQVHRFNSALHGYLDFISSLLSVSNALKFRCRQISPQRMPFGITIGRESSLAIKPYHPHGAIQIQGHFAFHPDGQQDKKPEMTSARSSTVGTSGLKGSNGWCDGSESELTCAYKGAPKNNSDRRLSVHRVVFSLNIVANG